MSIAGLRWLAVPLGLLAFTLRLTCTFWLTPIIWDMENGAARISALIAGLLLALGIPFTIYLLLTRRLHPPARFTSRDGQFTVPQNPGFAASQAIFWMYISAGLVMVERVPGGDSLRVFDWPASIIGVGIGCTGALTFLLVQRPRLHLDREGLTLRRLWSTTRVAWDQLQPGPPPAMRDGSMYVYLHGAPVAGNWPRIEIPLKNLYIDPAFLANALRHYREHPEDRAAIGTGDASALNELRA